MIVKGHMINKSLKHFVYRQHFCNVFYEALHSCDVWWVLLSLITS
jgi:hypothetical protein